MHCVVAGSRHYVRILHHRLNSFVLSQDAPEHASSVDPERLVCATHRSPHIVVLLLLVAACVPVKPQLVGVDAGQAPDRPARRLLLSRVRLQRMVHVRDSHPVRRQSEQVGVHSRARQHYRLRRHTVFLPRLSAHLSQKGCSS